jgi:prophage regulatory protein
MAFLRMNGVTRVTGLSESTIRRKVRENTFPKPVPLSEKDGEVTAWGWVDQEVDAWCSGRITARDGAPKQAA